MKRLIGIIMASIILASAAQAADCIATCSWDGLQVNGLPEGSLPVQIILFDADTQDTLTQASAGTEGLQGQHRAPPGRVCHMGQRG